MTLIPSSVPLISPVLSVWKNCCSYVVALERAASQVRPITRNSTMLTLEIEPKGFADVRHLAHTLWQTSRRSRQNQENKGEKRTDESAFFGMHPTWRRRVSLRRDHG